MSPAKASFRAFCSKPNPLPLFLQDWWLDVTCGEDEWDVILFEKGGNLQGILPYFHHKKYGFKGLAMPPLTHFLGYWIFYPKGQKPSTKLSHEKKVLTKLYQSLPNYSFFEQLISPQHSNWLPLYWLGYQQTTFYTYIIPDLEKLNGIFESMESRMRNTIRKAESVLEVRDDKQVDILYDMVAKSYKRNGEKITFTKELVTKMVDSCYQRNCGKIHYAVDADGRVHGASFTAWDEHSAYSILRGDDPELRNSGASSLLVWKAIQDCVGKTKTFDFAGSYIEPVEQFIRSFGAIQTPYFYITNEQSSLYYWMRKFYDYRKRKI